MVNRNRLKTAVIACVAIAVMVSLSLAAFHLFTRKTAENRMMRFFDSNTNKDILFIGTSQVAADVSPMELWEHYGYSSYILCAAKDGVQRDLAMLRIALQYTTPKLVVINTDRYWKQDSTEDQLAGFHMFADAFPVTRTKIDVTRELYDHREDRARILFPFSEYHARWKEISGEDFVPDPNPGIMRGATYGTGIGSPVQYDLIDPSEKEVPEGDGQKILGEIITECHEKGIEVFLLSLPLEADAKQQRYINSLDDLAESYGIEHVNLLGRTDIYDYDTDFSDGAHMNVSGSRKVTAYLGEQILPKYEIPSRYNDPVYMKEWGDDYAQYCEIKHEYLQSAGDLNSFLIQCHDDTLNLVLYIEGSSACFRDNTTFGLIGNIIDLQKIAAARENQQNYYAVIDYNNGLLQEEVVPTGDIETEASFGRAKLSFDDSGKPILTVGDDDKNYFEMEGHGDICIAVFDRWSGKHICTKAFKTSRVLKAESRDPGSKTEPEAVDDLQGQ